MRAARQRHHLFRLRAASCARRAAQSAGISISMAKTGEKVTVSLAWQSSSENERKHQCIGVWRKIISIISEEGGRRKMKMTKMLLDIKCIMAKNRNGEKTGSNNESIEREEKRPKSSMVMAYIQYRRKRKAASGGEMKRKIWTYSAFSVVASLSSQAQLIKASSTDAKGKLKENE